MLGRIRSADDVVAALLDAIRSGVDHELQVSGRGGSRTLEGPDLVARVGGDEFIVVIAGQHPDHVRPIIDRLAASANDDPNLPPGVRVRASLGAAHWSPDGDTSWNAAAERADAELYASRSARGIPTRDTR